MQVTLIPSHLQSISGYLRAVHLHKHTWKSIQRSLTFPIKSLDAANGKKKQGWEKTGKNEVAEKKRRDARLKWRKK